MESVILLITETVSSAAKKSLQKLNLTVLHYYLMAFNCVLVPPTKDEGKDVRKDETRK